MGLQRDMTDTAAHFAWPGRPRAQTPVDRLLDDARPIKATRSAAPGMKSKTGMRLQSYLKSLRSKGHNPDEGPWIVNIFGAQIHGMLGISPCLTRTRAAVGGHWITNLSRVTSIRETICLQGMPPDLNCAGITARQQGCMIGTATSVNVLERLLVRRLPAAGLVNRS